jgi:hypothetical protein
MQALLSLIGTALTDKVVASAGVTSEIANASSLNIQLTSGSNAQTQSGCRSRPTANHHRPDVPPRDNSLSRGQTTLVGRFVIFPGEGWGV